jgi:hypothetical protein
LSKNSFKTAIRERYRGRGNSWIKVPAGSETYSQVLNIVKSKSGTQYMSDIEKAGYAWIRYITPSGSVNKPTITCEIRYQGSKIEQPDTTIIIDDNIAKDLPLLGNTPFKLELEEKHIKPKKTKIISPKKKKKKKEKEEIVNETKRLQETFEEQIAREIDNAKEAALTLPTSQDLIQWKEFLSAEGLLEDDA